MVSFFIFIFGLIIGSFINALSFRYNSGKNMMGRSMCFSCGHTLSWFDLIPVLSFLLLWGRCRYCRTRISRQYFFVEIVSGLVFLFVFLKLGGYSLQGIGLISLLLSLIFWTSFIFISIYDIRHKIVPNEAVYLMILVGFAVSVFISKDPVYFVPVYFVLLRALLLFLPFFLIWLLSKGKWMGLGDGKIIFALGLFLPVSVSISGVILSFWTGSLYALLALYVNRLGLNLGSKKLTMKSELAFAPFLLLGSFYAYFFTIDLLNLSLW
jgi:prepilin signal peptidase PulO-like enzyme (type II secretory pathway)